MDRKTFSIPKTWRYIGDMLKGRLSYELLEGCIGKKATDEFNKFIELCKKIPEIRS